MADCGASKKDGSGPCGAPAMPNGRCYHHGGASLPAGPLHPRWKTGRYSKLVGKRKAEPEAETLSLLPDIRALDALAAIMQDQIVDKATHTPGELRTLALEFRTAPPDTAGSVLKALLDAIEETGEATAAIGRLRQLVIDRAKLAESERKLRVAETRTISEAEYVSAVIRIMELLDDIVTETAHRQRLAAELTAIAERRPGEALPTAMGEPEFIIDSPGAPSDAEPPPA